jgi:Activator of Hsp90 ATPase homolog 1-like protein
VAIEPLRYAIEVACPTDHAFAVWTEKASSWWPPSHTMGGQPGMTVVFEGRVGGRIYERTAAGAEHEWGEVTIWEPPRRLGYLWHIATDRADATEVEIKFVEVVAGDDARTRVEIEHRGWERLGERGPSWRDANEWGWDGVLPPYSEACAAA